MPGLQPFMCQRKNTRRDGRGYEMRGAETGPWSWAPGMTPIWRGTQGLDPTGPDRPSQGAWMLCFLIYLFGCAGSYLQHVGSSVFTVACRIFSCSLWDRTQGPCTGTRSLSLWTQGSPSAVSFRCKIFGHFATCGCLEREWFIFLQIQKSGSQGDPVWVIALSVINSLLSVWL